MLIVFVMALPMLVGCDGLPAPAQYDDAMLREYFEKSPAEVEGAFGKPSSVTQADSQLPPENATAEEQEKFNQANESMSYVYSTSDGKLVFHFNRNNEVFAITYAGRTVSPPDPPSSVETGTEVEDGGVVASEDRDRVNAFFQALGEVRSAEEEKAVVNDLTRWLKAKGYKVEVEQQNGKHILSCPYFPPVTPWTSHSFFDEGNLDLLPAATAFLIDMDGAKHRLPMAETSFLAGVVSRRPDVDTADHIKFDPKYRVIVDGVDLALQPDELILMHRGGTKSWNSSGVRARILASAGIR
jgi:hypothetical protein